ncbi:Rap1a/Tai family immunity protein [Pigmentiphaga aceris]|uniref:Rap1a/Tai family immunity protein n=1 Tax=Pigmentiphaga aceris TaxID=1940612 RepID=UPI001FECA52C|nr:Rap1a/Tai family immunity protein [Pigmentiphaga aceris]
MSKRFISLCVLLAATTVCHAQDNRTWYLSGAELKEALEGKRPSEVRDEAMRKLYSSAYAQAYITGIADQGQGKSWCTRGAVLPHELSDRVHTYLTDRPEAGLRGKAAPLVANALGRAFPCQASKPAA